MRITKRVRLLTAYTPGEQPKQRGVVKLNTNENPYLPSPKCARVLKDFDLENLRKYPDPVFTELRLALARLNGTSPENIFVGNGSDEILSLAVRTFVEDDEAIGSLDPSYSLYTTLADIRGVPWNTGKISLMLWTNPNAPTGEFAEPKAIADFARRFKGVVLVDEAYADFARANAMALATAKGNRNVIVMRTFSKSYSLAGLRVGYCVGPKDLIAALYKMKDSYNVDAIAQAVALAAVRDQAWMRRNVRRILATRRRLTRELERRGWCVTPSEANFVFAKPARIAAKRLFRALRERNIFVRFFDKPKTRDFLRITIGTDDQIDELLRTIDELTV